MKSNEIEAMHRIADAYQTGMTLLESERARGTAMVEQALVEAHRMGARDVGGDPDVPPERFIEFWELWQAWRFGKDVNLFGPLDAPVFEIASRESFEKRGQLFAQHMGLCPWPPRWRPMTLVQELSWEAALSAYECF